MTTKRQVKRLLDQFLARNTDLAMAGPRPMVALRPARHFLCGVFIERTSSAATFKPHWNLTCLFTLRHGVSVHDGCPVSHGGRLWQWTRPSVEEELCEKVEAEILPKLRALSGIAESISGEAIFSRPLAWHGDRMIAHVAMGKLDAARAIWTERQAVYHRTDWFPERQTEIDQLKQFGPLLVADDRAGLAALLHAWEAASVENLGIAHLWERTPFPLETAGPNG